MSSFDCKNQFLEEARKALINPEPFGSLSSVARKYAEEGMDQHTMERLLLILSRNVSETEYEVICDVYDLVVGYGPTSGRIFPGPHMYSEIRGAIDWAKPKLPLSEGEKLHDFVLSGVRSGNSTAELLAGVFRLFEGNIDRSSTLRALKEIESDLGFEEGEAVWRLMMAIVLSK